jgi:Cadherin-like beta sandwich domain/FG-GAP repeat
MMVVKSARNFWVVNLTRGYSIVFAFLLLFTTGCDWFGGSDDPEPEIPSDINELIALTVSEGTLSPAFTIAETNYVVEVENAIESIRVTATLESDVATLQINGEDAVSGVASNEIALVEGANLINVVATSESGLSRTIVLTVNRALPDELSVLLTSLTLTNITYSPTFEGETIEYTATVSGDIDSTVITAVTEDPNATLVYGSQQPVTSGASSQAFELAVGENNLAVEVHSADEANIKAYYITVTREQPLSNNADLNNLSLSTGSLSPGFDSGTTDYTSTVNFGVESVSVTLEIADENAVATVNGEVVTSQQPSQPIALQEGNNSISVAVTAEDGTSTKAYSVVVVRQAAPLPSNLIEENILISSNYEALDGFSVVAAHGNTLVVGAPREDSGSAGVGGDQSDNSKSSSGAVYVFVRELIDDEYQWRQQAYLKASNPGASPGAGHSGDLFGLSVAIWDDTLVVGAPYEDSNSTGVNSEQNNEELVNAGAVYVFIRDGENWTQQAYLKPSTQTIFGTRFGTSVDIHKHEIIVGAPAENSRSTGVNGDETNTFSRMSGAAYVFKRDANNEWSQNVYLKASTNDPSDQFGEVVRIHDGTAAVGSTFESSNAQGINGDERNNSAQSSGAVWVFSESNGEWAQEAYIKSSNSETQDNFSRGIAMDLRGDRLAVGAWFEDSNATGVDGDQLDNSSDGSGSVYIFEKDGDQWMQTAYIKASNTDAGDSFGYSISLASNKLLVGARREDSGASGINGDESDNSIASAGAAYLFQLENGLWQQTNYIKPSVNQGSSTFGSRLAITNEFIAIDTKTLDSKEVVYVFREESE